MDTLQSLPAPELRPAEKLREVDREVAEALGWTRLKEYSDGWWGVSPEGRDFVDLPPYTTDLGAAWECVTWLRERGYSFGFWLTPRISSFLRSPTAAFKRSLRPPSLEDGAGVFAADDPNPATAIVRAFLAVVEAHPELRGKGHE